MSTAQPIVGGQPVPTDAADNAAGLQRYGWPHVVWMSTSCTGVVVHPEVVVYAAHCGTDFRAIHFGNQFEVALPADLESGDLQVLDWEAHPSAAIESCATYPGGGVGTTKDLAYCILSEPVADLPVLPLLTGCERDAVDVGTRTTLVGFGFEGGAGPPGTKRSVEAQVESYYLEFGIGDDEVGTCRGDSGGPAFVEVTGSAVPEETDWRLLGILSAGEVGRCGLGYYADIANFVDWLESETQRDLTPCYDAEGEWAPTAECTRVGFDGDGFLQETGDFANVCGPPFEPPPANCSAPPARRSHSGAWMAVALASALVAARRRLRQRP